MKHRHKIFVAAYLRTYNATEAARIAGYSETRAGNAGNILLKTPAIKRHISEVISARMNGQADIIRARIFELWEKIALEPDLTEGTVHDKIAAKAMQLKASELLAKYLPPMHTSMPTHDDEEGFRIVKIKAARPHDGVRVLPAPEADTVH